MILRSLLALLLLLATGTVSVAQQPEFVTVKPGEILAGSFVQSRHLKTASGPLRSEGRFVLAPGRGLIWRGERPFAVVSVITASGIVQTIDGVEAMRMPAARVPFLRQFFDMLSGALAGDLTAMERDFAVTRSAEGGKWRLVLEPARPGEPLAAQIRSISLTGERFLEIVEVRKVDGDWDTLAFAGQTVSRAGVTPEDARLFEMVKP